MKMAKLEEFYTNSLSKINIVEICYKRLDCYSAMGMERPKSRTL